MTADFAQKYETASEDVLAELKKTMESIDPASLERLVDEVLKADQVFFVGVGRVMLALQCICKRFAHLGIRAHCVGEITGYQKRRSSDRRLRLRRFSFPSGDR